MNSELYHALLIASALVALMIISRLIAGYMDGMRIKSYFEGIGCDLLSRRWKPLGPGWMGARRSRIYEVVYRDPVGRVYQSHIKTSMMSGVYLTGNRIIEDVPNGSIEDELVRLRARLEELEKLTSKSP